MVRIANETVYNEALGILESEVIAIINELTLKVFVCHDQELVNSIIDDIEKYQTPNCILQVVPRNLIVSERHVKLAAYLTFRAFEKERNISRKKYMEMLLYLFGERQIGKVIEKMRRFGRSPYLVIVACRGVANEITEILRRNNLMLEHYCSKLKSRMGEDPLEANIDINAVRNVFEICGTDDIVKAVLCKVSSLILQA
ncbi:MAG: hypothetical protein DRO14_02625 [Thermoprotei archaeon]|nr:MAG: hypothetical protein DRO14_02625 [Thermoprotei archaeon]